uniref:Uncharacterized protein n=1 Tax=Oryza nivara TaxID=4536 RepID=A0A0E0GNN0_ORYNI
MAHRLLLIVLVASILHTVSSATVYDVLQQNNLPRGLIPQGVTSYVLHPDGHLEVTLPGECNFAVTVGGSPYKFLFDSKFVGLSARKKAIVQVDQAGNQLTFKVGTSSISFPISDFTSSPSGSISEVNGVRVQVKYAFEAIIQVDHAGNQLTFKVGTSSISFPISDFTSSPVCG